eukprot:10960932-Ditylum_brightwellii.AAC.1
MAKVIRDRPTELAGVAMTCLIDVQGTEQVNFFLRHTRSDSQATQLVKIAVAWAQHQSGWHESILTYVKNIFPHFEARCQLLLDVLQRNNNSRCYLSQQKTIRSSHAKWYQVIV